MTEKQQHAFNVIPEIKPKRDIGSSSLSERKEYSLPAEQVDVLDMLTTISDEMPRRQREIIDRAWHSPLWGEHVSLRDIPGFENRFARVTGAIRLPVIQSDSSYASFFTEGRVHDRKKGRKNNRGARYYIALDSSLNAAQKTDVLHEDIQAAVHVMKEAEEHPPTPDELFLHLGVADYLKNGFTTAYHALTYGERTGYLPKDERYYKHRETLEKYAVEFTRSFFQTSIGQPPEEDFDAGEVSQRSAEAFAYVREYVTDPTHFKLAEVDHPLIIMANAHENARVYSQTDVVIGLPSGGTQSAIATQLAMELMHGVSPELALVPLSTHSAKRVLQDELSDSRLRGILRNLPVAEKHVLITDDTTNTGKTLQKMHDALVDSGASEVYASVCEVDPIRIMVKQGLWAEPPQIIANLAHGDFSTAVDVVPITRGRGEISSDRQLRKISGLLVLDEYYRQSAPIIPENPLTPEAPTDEPVRVKVCGVHNSADLATVVQNGVSMIGIHATYDDAEGYKRSLAKKGSALASLENRRAQELYDFKKLPLPWAEYKALKAMMEDIHTKNIDVTSVFLMRPKNPKEVGDVLQVLLPKNFNKGVMVQMQSYYDSEFLNQVREDLNAQGLTAVRLIQTVGMDDPEAHEKVRQLNSDPNADFILFDSSQRGGTGEARTKEEIANIMSLSEKQMFLAGGLKPDTIGPLLTDLHEQGIKPFGVDVESSLEYPKGTQSIGAYKTESGPLVIIRKDAEKVSHFVSNIQEVYTKSAN